MRFFCFFPRFAHFFSKNVLWEGTCFFKMAGIFDVCHRFSKFFFPLKDRKSNFLERLILPPGLSYSRNYIYLKMMVLFSFTGGSTLYQYLKFLNKKKSMCCKPTILRKMSFFDSIIHPHPILFIFMYVYFVHSGKMHESEWPNLQ
mgnify:CR=1 FL=1